MNSTLKEQVAEATVAIEAATAGALDMLAAEFCKVVFDRLLADQSW